MPGSWRLVTRNWSASRGTAVACIVSVALGVGVVLANTGFHETALNAIADEVVNRWLGNAHLTVYPPGGHWGTLDTAIVDPIRALPEVKHVTARLQRRMKIARPRPADATREPVWRWIDAVGINPETEHHFRTVPELQGRTFNAGERGVAIAEAETAAELNVTLGQKVAVTPYEGGAEMTFTLVGLYETQRVAEFAPPTVYLPIEDVRTLSTQPNAASAVDIMLHDASPDALEDAKRAVETLVAQHDTPYPYRVESAAGRRMLLDEAERISRILYMLVAFIALLTSFFIILTTMSVSLLERRNALGIQRCIGMTRGHLAALLLAELFPLGVIGTALGLGLGYVTTRIVAYQATGDAATVEFTPWAIGLAALSGLITTLAGAAALIAQVTRTAPLVTANPYAKPAKLRYALAAGVVGVAALIAHEAVVRDPDQTQWITPAFAFAGVGSLYLGYVLLAPAIVVLLGPLLSLIAGPLLGLPSKLTRDQLGRTPWKSSGVCWVLMVGVSMIAYIAITTEAILAIWDFPGRLPEAFIWSPDYVPEQRVERVRDLPGVEELTTTTDVECKIEDPTTQPQSVTQSMVRMLVDKLSRPVFVAGHTDQILDMIKVVFIEGSLEEAREKLKRGGYVLLPTQTSRNRNLHVGDKVRVTISDRTAEFEIAGVVQSPAMDLAVTAFQATSYMQIASASAVLGTQQDLREKFDLHIVSMVMCNLDLPESDPPVGFDPKALPDYTDNRAVAQAMLDWSASLPNENESLTKIEPALRKLAEHGRAESMSAGVEHALLRFRKAIRRLTWVRERERLTPDQAWTMFRERLVLLRMADELDRPDAIMGSLRRLKIELDRGLRRATGVITWLPSIMLVIAAVGVGNLMMINIRIRARQIAMLRAVGAVKSQILRLVLSEAAILGLLGALLGLALGFHQAYSRNRILASMLGFHIEYIVPAATIAAAVALTVAICLLAGLPPARRAARENILATLQTE